MAMDELKYKDGKFTVNGADVSNVSATTEISESVQEISANTSQFSVVDNPEYIEVKLDAEDKILEVIDTNGVKHFFNNVSFNNIAANKLELTNSGLKTFEEALKKDGFQLSGTGDWSDAKSLSIAEPRSAVANISGVDAMPTAKNVNLHAYFEFWDRQGNYFNKKILLNAQGNGSMLFPKKNFAIDLCNDDWIGDDTFELTIGDWVPQDSFHFKAFYCDYFKGSSIISYQIARDVMNTRDLLHNRPWKNTLLKNFNFWPETYGYDEVNDNSIQTNLDARCQPDAFPCLVYLNNEFYGIYSFALKKHRDNFMMNKSTAEHIHLDGYLAGNTIFDGSVNWTQFEVRNPKGLLTNIATGHGYSEISTEPSEYTDSPDNVKPSDMTEDDIIAAFGSIEEAPKYLKYITSKGKIKYFQFGTSFEAYDGDHPKELLGEDTVGYDPTNSAHVFTNTVKQYILKFSKYVPEIKEEESVEGKKTLFGKYYDTDSLLQYQIVNSLVRDWDAHAKNWQWVTWDGVKWSVCEYDKDLSFGNTGEGNYLKPCMTSGSWMIGYGGETPTKYFSQYFDLEIAKEWKKLVDLGILTTENIFNKFIEWMSRYTPEAYKLEYKKWNEAPVNRDSQVNSEFWQISSKNFPFESADTYESGKTYNVGETCYYGADNFHFQFKCIKESLGNPPLLKLYNTRPRALGYRDNIYRLYNYIDQTLSVMNNWVNNKIN